MKLVRVDYKDLNAKQKEIYNFQVASAFLAGYGFNCIKLADDWQGADFLAYHKDGGQTLKVQLKGRVSVHKKYIGKELYMCFPVDNKWFLIEHDELLRISSKSGKMTKTESWELGTYSFPRPSRSMMEDLKPYALEPPNFESQSIELG